MSVARLSPLKHKNLNLPGRYSFTASVPAAGSLRPLRDPDAPGLDDDEGGDGLAGLLNDAEHHLLGTPDQCLAYLGRWAKLLHRLVGHR
ncbi:hypothetical protein AB0937_35265 [Streptomyces sp. NPDC047880]|uniref:hypothetical protein n=1 Tax=Streptomyces sp. NPDC047880 TaxID=3155626 RepID=UPI003452023F